MDQSAIVLSRDLADFVTLFAGDEEGSLHRSSINTEHPMGSEDVAAGKAKQIKGKVNDVVGAIKGDTGQQIKGKVQKAVGKVQESLGKQPK
jgi:uncharacterized protein YjbJ (UPF0337 family)